MRVLNLIVSIPTEAQTVFVSLSSRQTEYSLIV